MRRAVLGLAGALVGAGLLAGCSGTPGAAAVVDGVVIPPADLRVATEQLGSLLQNVSTTSVLSVMIQEPAILAVADDHGVVASRDEAEKLLGQVAEQNKTPLPELAPATLDVARTLISQGKLQDLGQDSIGDEIAERIAALEVEVNPRFGTAGEQHIVEAPAAPAWFVAAKDAGADVEAPASK